MTMSSSDFPIQVMLREKDEPKGYAEGGLATAADLVRGAGRGGDDIIIHINADELQELREMWGEPTINPETGAPEFFLKGLQDWFKDNEWAGYALPVATSMIAPGIGNAIGGTVNDALGLGLEATGINTIGQGLVGAGLGALTGGGKGALIGGLLGGATGYINAPSMPTVGQGGMGPDAPAGFKTSGGESVRSGGALDGLLGGGSALTKALPLALAMGALSSGGGNEKPKANTISPEHQEARDRMTRPLSKVEFKRTRAPDTSDPRRAGYVGERDYFKNNQIPDMPGYADGGDVEAPALDMVANDLPSRYVEGPGDGRDDAIPAAVANGEYIMDAEITALLGNGSSEAGAKVLDEFRENIRRHKGAALAEGRISPDAKPALEYLPKGSL